MQISGVTIQGGMNILPAGSSPSPSPTPGPSDPDFSNVVFMFDGDGTNGGANNTFTDSSTNSHTITKNGDVTQGSFSPYGDNWSWYTKDSAISFTNYGSGTFETSGNYTAECWVTFEGVDSSGYNIIFYGGNNTQLTIVSTGGIGTVLNGSVVINSNYSADTNDGSWHHVAWCRSGSTNRVFLDGNLVASGTSSNTIRIDQISGYSSGYEHNGRISNVRITNTALYTSNFTPPTAPLTEITGTHILTAQSNRIVDNSSNNRPLVIARGTPKVTPFSPFKNDDARDITTDGGSANFGGSSTEYLSVSATSSFDFGTSDFTVECWFYENNILDGFALLGSTSGSNIYFGYGNSGGTAGMTMYGDGVDIYSGASSIPQPRQWNHLVWQRNGGRGQMYLNGTRVYDATYGQNFPAAADGFLVGKSASYTNYYADGYISDFRVVKGTGVYSGASITVPTSPLTAVTNTTLLLNFQDAGIYDYSGLNNIDTVGDAQIDTSVKKYGTGSIKFDGSGDYLKTSGNEALMLGSGDWTIEFWVYFDVVNNGQVRFLFDWRTSTDTSNSFLAQEADNEWTYWNGAGTDINEGWSASTFNTSTWHHVAISKEGTTNRFFVDGINTASSSDVSNYDSGTLVIGSRYNGQNYLDGYIDDLRVTKGLARYTANFTAPAAALPKF